MYKIKNDTHYTQYDLNSFYRDTCKYTLGLPSWMNEEPKQMSDGPCLNHCICLLLHLIWTHMQKGGDAIHGNKNSKTTFPSYSTFVSTFLDIFTNHIHLYFL